MQEPKGLRGQESSVHTLFGLTDDRFRAPEFQRHFVWGKAELDSFWEDLSQLIDEEIDDGSMQDQPALFLGAVVLQALEPGPPGTGVLYSIIDGQQRITTLYLTLVAVAEAFQDAGHPDTARYMSTEYLLTRALKFEHQPRVEPTVSDRGVMADIMSCLENPPPRSNWTTEKSPDASLYQAWTRIRQEVRDRCLSALGESRIDVEALERLRDRILHQIELVTITLGNRHNSHEVYERLNHRGKELTELDLVRNAVFFTAGGDPNTTRVIYQYHWNPFESQLASQQDAFWFPYAMIRVPSTTRARSYSDLVDYWKSKLTNGRQGSAPAQAIVADLREFLDGFRAISGLTDNADSAFDKAVWDALMRLRRMDAPPVMYPFLMQLVQHHLNGTVSSDKVVSAIRTVDSFLVRRRFCGIGTTGIHAVFKSLWNVVKDDLDEVPQVLIDRKLQFTDDEEFARGIREHRLYRVKATHRKYVLAEYETSFPGDKSYPLPDDITTDHLLPQGVDPLVWGSVSQEDRDSLVDTWANLVPLSQDAQNQKGAKNWVDQRKLMVDRQGTVYKSTREVFDLWPNEWTAETLRERADYLVDWALMRWPREIPSTS